MKLIKSNKLSFGDTVAVVSPSSGAPSLFPHVYENGLEVLRQWGLTIKEYPTTKADPTFLKDYPEIRAQDLNEAFADTNIKAIITSIGGEDSVRILPFLDKKIISSNPKIFMGFSDASTIHVFCREQGLGTFYGPSVMAGFSQMQNLPDRFQMHVRQMLFEPSASYIYQPYEVYCDGYPDWSDPNVVGRVHSLKMNTGWRWLQGQGITQGTLFGGCLETLERMKETEFWPSLEVWDGALLFLETSERKSPLHIVENALRDYGRRGVFETIGGLLFGRARGYAEEEKLALETSFVSIIADEFGRTDMPIIANFDVGHTDPQFVLPLGVKGEIHCEQRTIRLVEHWLR